MGLLDSSKVAKETDNILQAVKCDIQNSLIEGESETESIPEEFQEFDEFTKKLRRDDLLKVDAKVGTLQMNPVTWTTPLGLPIVQPYFNEHLSIIETHIQTFHVKSQHENPTVSVLKQAAAFPPNFIHSLDASHMMLSAVACQSKKVNFASVHDSYWTHPSDVDEMNKILRESFIQLHSQNIMGRLNDEFYTRYQDMRTPVKINIETKDKDVWHKYLEGMGRYKASSIVSFAPFSLPPLPARGSLNIELVRDSVYFFH
jgi:DNA-directed RNA polymerase